MEKKWSRGDKLAVGGLLLAAVATIAAIFVVPEFRQFLHLDRPQTARAEAKPTQNANPQSTPPVQSTEPSNAEPRKPDTSKPKKPTQKTKTHVTGNDNIAGNNISGDNNVLGNNNQTGPTANAPNGIAIAGGTVTNPMVNNFVPQQRRLTAEQQSQVANCLGQTGASSVFVAFAQHNFEAQTYSDDFVAALKAGGWTTKTYPVPYTEMRVGSGVQVQVGDLKNAPHIAEVLAGCLTNAHIKIFGMKNDMLPIGEIMLYIGVPEASQ
jgi:hypothetical protein